MMFFGLGANALEAVARVRELLALECTIRAEDSASAAKFQFQQALLVITELVITDAHCNRHSASE